ncbi:MAG: hypothetical protein MUE30_09855 [Spirosomaceae bacterium]|nr:hypothetical protein [Spirosomataceae bacterium]
MFYSTFSMKYNIKSFFHISKKKLLKELWKQFITQTEEYYWEEYASGKNTAATQNFKEDLVTTKFSNAFAIYFQKTVLKQIDNLSKLNMPVPNTGNEKKTSISSISLLNNYFKPNKFSDDAKESTINLFCLFLGYHSFDDFQEKNYINLLPIGVQFYLKYPKIVYLSVCVFVILTGLIIFLKTNLPEDDDIKELITLANQTEFESYKKLDQFDTTHLDLYWAKGIARHRIMNILKKHPQMGRVLVDTLKASGAKIINFKIILKTRYYIRLETEEHWHLQWYNVNTKVFEKEYDRVDTQIYELINSNKRWKIWDNWHIKKPESITIH